MNVKWMLEPDAFPNDPYYLQWSIEDRDIPHTVCKLGQEYVYYTRKYPKDDLVVFHGSVQFAEVIRSHTNWKVIWNVPAFECSYYYPLFAEHLVNREYIFLPFEEVVAKKEMLYRQYGDTIFLKSDAFKEFTGMPIREDQWAQEIRKIDVYAEPSTVVLVAGGERLLKEWRLVVSKGVVVAGSMYKPHRGPVEERVLRYAEEVLGKVEFDPDPIWTLDIAETEDGLRVLEVGPFSCCALYECYSPPIIEAVNRIYEG